MLDNPSQVARYITGKHCWSDGEQHTGDNTNCSKCSMHLNLALSYAAGQHTGGQRREPTAKEVLLEALLGAPGLPTHIAPAGERGSEAQDLDKALHGVPSNEHRKCYKTSDRPG